MGFGRAVFLTGVYIFLKGEKLSSKRVVTSNMLNETFFFYRNSLVKPDTYC